MKRVIEYRYHYWDLGCECCSDSSSSYCMYEDGVLVEEDAWCELCSDEEELKDVLKELLPFDVHPDSEWF